MSRRGTLAAVVLILWLAGLAALGRRDTRHAPAQQLAEAALRVAPGTWYYRVRDGDRHAGFALARVDTGTARIATHDVLVFRPRGARGPSSSSLEAAYSRGLRLLSFDLHQVAGTHETWARGEMSGDTLLLLAVRHDAGSVDSITYRLTRPVLLPSMVPIVIALGRPLRAGLSRAVVVFDPRTLRPTRVDVHVRAESVFVISDSARVRPGTARWEGTNPETVRAWHLVAPALPELTGWIDGEGHVLHARSALTHTVLERAPFEVAFLNWPDRTVVGLDRLGMEGHAPLGTDGPTPRAPVPVPPAPLETPSP